MQCRWIWSQSVSPKDHRKPIPFHVSFMLFIVLSLCAGEVCSQGRPCCCWGRFHTGSYQWTAEISTVVEQIWEICWRTDSREQPDPPSLAGWKQTEFLSIYCSIVYVRISRALLGSLDGHTQLLNRPIENPQKMISLILSFQKICDSHTFYSLCLTA